MDKCTIIGLAAALFASPVFGAGAVNDVTSRMENLGVPLEKRYPDQSYGGCGAYARNVWSLAVFDGRLYVGAGNSSNGGPASNAGPVPVVAYDPKTKRFATEWSVPDEQVDVFRTLRGGVLYIPGHDPKEDWKFGNLYRRAAGGNAKWEKVRTLPDGVHCYDVEEFDGRLVACGYGTYESADDGKTFDHTQGPRYYCFFRFPKAIYAVGVGQSAKDVEFKGPKGKVMKARRPEIVALSRRAAGGRFEFVRGVKPATVFPDTPELATEELRAARPAPIGDRILFIGGIVHNDHQIAPLGAYLATDGAQAFSSERVKLPAGAVPWATMSAGRKAYLLFATPDGKKAKFRNHVWETSNGKVFKELFVFDTPTFARAMAYLDGCFYFGLGTEVGEHGGFQGGNSLSLRFKPDELQKESGTILRYRTVLR